MKLLDVIDDVTNRCAVGTFLWDLYLTRTPKRLSFRHIYFSIKVADTDTDTSTDNKGRLKLSSRASQ